MLTGDLANSPLASTDHTPADEADSLRDFLLEAFLNHAKTMPPNIGRGYMEQAAVCLDAGFEEAQKAGVVESSQTANNTQIIRILQLVAGDNNKELAIRAICYLRLLNLEKRSFEEIGNYFGVCRANVQIIYRKIQRQHPTLRSRADKSDSAREASRQIRLGRRKQSFDWPTRSLWKPLPLL